MEWWGRVGADGAGAHVSSDWPSLEFSLEAGAGAGADLAQPPSFLHSWGSPIRKQLPSS